MAARPRRIRDRLLVVRGAFHGFDLLVPDAEVSRQFSASWKSALRKAFATGTTEQGARKQRGINEIHLFGYFEPGKFENMSESERNTVLDECLAICRTAKNGLAAEEPLQPPNTAVTVSWKNGKVAVTDGPYAETKEYLGGIQGLEARDLNHAIQLVSQPPVVKLNVE